MNAKSDSRTKVKLDIISLTIVLATLERCSTRDYIHEIDDVFADAVEHQIILPKESIDTTWEIDLSGMRCVFSFHYLHNFLLFIFVSPFTPNRNRKFSCSSSGMSVYS